MLTKIKTTTKSLVEEYKCLLRSVPSLVLTFFVVSVVAMNIFASKEVMFPILNFGGDCGTTLSWISFLAMDIIVKRFGPKASIMLNIAAEVINLIFCGCFFLISLIPGNWSMFYEYGDVANVALDATFANSWYVVLGSAVAFVISGFVNAGLNWLIGKAFKKTSFLEYSIRSYVSTLISQFVDNLVFALLVAFNFFGWTFMQCVLCAVLGCIIELLAEMIFGSLGYRIVKNWEKDNVGAEYIDKYLKSEVK